MIYNWKLRNELDDYVGNANIMGSRQKQLTNFCERKYKNKGFSVRTVKLIKFAYLILGLIVAYLAYCVWG